MRISDAARTLANPPPPPAPAQTSAEAQAIQASADAVENDPFLQLVKSMVEFLTGRPVKVFSARELSRQVSTATVETTQATRAANPNRPAGYGVEYDYHAAYEEKETTRLSAEGVVRTADGQEIKFRLDLAMERSYREETNVSLRAGDAVRKDPLVINFAGTAAQLSSQRFNFDLNGDGRAENLPMLAGGSGYLALDLNGNGRIDSGKELFGPATGAGFAELARHDQDGNGWIDGNDAVFDKLRIWTPAADGAGSSRSLKEAGVGAISLGRVATPFELRGNGNADLGAVRTSGVWLNENGKAGSVQEIDLTV